MNKMHYSLDDIALVPADFTDIKSRKDVNTTTTLCGHTFSIPVVSSNMSSVYSPELAQEIARLGAISCVHRFCTIEQNVKLFQDGIYQGIKPWVSIGVGSSELERAEALVSAGAEVIVIDLANGACQSAVNQYRALKELFKVKVVVGNFSTARQINEFVNRAGSIPDAFKVGQGNGSACLTSIRTGIGYPAVSCITECASTGYNIIYDGVKKVEQKRFIHIIRRFTKVLPRSLLTRIKVRLPLLEHQKVMSTKFLLVVML
jgi:IMP dehydrogenase